MSARPRSSLFTLLMLLALVGSALAPHGAVAQAPVVAPPTFSHPRGFYASSFNLTLAAEAGMTIRYTTDGSAPAPSKGTVYNGGNIGITRTTVVRAIAYNGGNTSAVATNTYLFLAKVREQSNTPLPGWPSRFAASDEYGYYPHDYEVDPQVWDHSNNSGKFDQVMKSLPTVSINTDLPNLWDTNYGIYYNPNAKEGDPVDPYNGPGVQGKWERPISMEWINPDGTSGFAVDGGLRLNGQASRRAHRQPKKSFRVYFRALEYGTAKLDFKLFDHADPVSKFDRLIFRNGGNRNWSYVDRDQRREADYVNDEFARRAWLNMGNIAPHGTYVHLYLNGLYWGLYNLTERIDAKFVQAYMGGSDLDYTVVEADEDIGDLPVADPPDPTDAWGQLINAVGGSAPITDAQYEEIKTRVDVVNLADYFVHVHYVGKTDWPHHNWNAFRRITGRDQRFKFIPWDNDSGLNKVTENITTWQDAKGPDDAPSRVFLRLMSNAEFRQVVADRLYKHVVDPTGALTATSCTALYTHLTGIIDQAIIAESGRWGDYMRDTYPTTNSLALKPFPAYLHSRDLPDDYTGVITTGVKKTWVKVRDEKLANYCPQRSTVLVSQYVQNSWYQTALKPPLFSQFGGAIPNNFELTLNNNVNNNIGHILYTIDGSDPRLEYGAVASTALDGGDLKKITINEVTTVRARVLNGTLWSPLVEYTFYPPQPFENLVISEIHYSPVAPTVPVGENPDDYEFVELHNRGTVPLRLDNAFFTRGMSYRFPLDTTIWPGQYLVLASKPGKFDNRYGFAPFGNNRGNLSNIGEGLQLNDAVGNVIDTVDYLPIVPWPTGANGSGGSLCLPDPNSDNSLPTSWTTGVENGTPGMAGCATPVATQPIVWLSQSAIDFGEQPVAQPSLPETVTLANAGARPLNLSSISASGDFAVSHTCPISLTVGASCTLSLTFTPTVNTPRSGAATISSDALNAPHTIALTGQGVGGFRAIILAPDGVNFGNQEIGVASVPQAVTVTNGGTLPVAIGEVSTSDDFTATSDCPASLPAGASCTLNVVFTPTARESKSGTLRLATNAPNTPHTVALSGTGVGGAPDLALSTDSIAFEEQIVGTTSAPLPLTITNGGTASANISGIEPSVGFAASHDCPASLLPGASCTVNVTFTPAAVGVQTGTLTISSNDAASPQVVALGGSGVNGVGATYTLFLPIVRH